MTTPTQFGPTRPWWLWPVVAFAAAVVVSVVAIVVADDEDSSTVEMRPGDGRAFETLPHFPEEGFEEDSSFGESQVEVEPDGDATVVGEGFSTFQDPEEFDGFGYSYAAVVENPTDARARFVEVRALVRDSAGTIITTAYHQIEIMDPGGTAAVAGEGFDTARVSSVDFQVEVDTWVEPGTPLPTFAITDVKTEQNSFGDLETTALVSNESDDELDSFLQLVAVHRDASGKIIGGAVGGLEFVPPGETARATLTGSFVEGVEATEVYVFP